MVASPLIPRMTKNQTQIHSNSFMSDADPLELPQQAAFGIDIGGTLSKVVYFAPDERDGNSQTVHDFITSSQTYGQTGTRDEHFSYRIKGGTLHFIKFETRRMHAFLDLVSQNALAQHLESVTITGGGAHKYESLFEEILRVKIVKPDEMECLVLGVHFLIRTAVRQLFYFNNTNFSEEIEKVHVSVNEFREPFLLVNIGSGVSILRIDGPDQYKRVGGSSLGGSTFLALARLLTGAETYSGALKLASEGDSTQVDMLVRDIYGRGYDALGLSGTVVASSFGKMIHPDHKAKPSDLAKAALIMVTNNIGSIVHLHSKIEGVTNVVFAGNFLENNIFSMRTLAFAMEFWSGGSTRALFLEIIGYSGAVGALIHNSYHRMKEKQQSK